MTQPLIGTTVYSSHDSLGNPGTAIDPNGNSTIYTYDSTGRVLTVKAPGDTAATQHAVFLRLRRLHFLRWRGE